MCARASGRRRTWTMYSGSHRFRPESGAVSCLTGDWGNHGPLARRADKLDRVRSRDEHVSLSHAVMVFRLVAPAPPPSLPAGGTRPQLTALTFRTPTPWEASPTRSRRPFEHFQTREPHRGVECQQRRCNRDTHAGFHFDAPSPSISRQPNAFRSTCRLFGTAVAGSSLPSISSDTQPLKFACRSVLAIRW